jgi:hypothetical protein
MLQLLFAGFQDLLASLFLKDGYGMALDLPCITGPVAGPSASTRALESKSSSSTITSTVAAVSSSTYPPLVAGSIARYYVDAADKKIIGYDYSNTAAEITREQSVMLFSAIDVASDATVKILMSFHIKPLTAENAAHLLSSYGTEVASARYFHLYSRFFASLLPPFADDDMMALFSRACPWVAYHTAATAIGSLWKRVRDTLGPVTYHIFSETERASLERVLVYPSSSEIAADVNDVTLAKLHAALAGLTLLPAAWPRGNRAAATYNQVLYTTIRKACKQFVTVATHESKIEEAQSIGDVINELDIAGFSGIPMASGAVASLGSSSASRVTVEHITTTGGHT